MGGEKDNELRYRELNRILRARTLNQDELAERDRLEKTIMKKKENDDNRIPPGSSLCFV